MYNCYHTGKNRQKINIYDFFENKIIFTEDPVQVLKTHNQFLFRLRSSDSSISNCI